MRLKNGAGALRVVKEKTVIGDKLLQPGNSILIPFHQLHTNEHVWGPTVGDFDPSRFLEKKSLARHPSFRPFGGGTTYCPGRVIAKEQVFGFIAVLLHRFDIKLAQAEGSVGEKPPFPLLNDSVPSLGINGPLSGMDIIVDMILIETTA
jgi:cholesterol 7alpha-monooxygenase